MKMNISTIYCADFCYNVKNNIQINRSIFILQINHTHFKPNFCLDLFNIFLYIYNIWGPVQLPTTNGLQNQPPLFALTWLCTFTRASNQPFSEVPLCLVIRESRGMKGEEKKRRMNNNPTLFIGQGKEKDSLNCREWGLVVAHWIQLWVRPRVL